MTAATFSSSFMHYFDQSQQWLFESVVQPLLYAVGMTELVEPGFDATMWVMIGVLQILLLLVVFCSLEKWRPVEPVIDKKQIRIDMIYTFIHRMGVFRLVLFFSLAPIFDSVMSFFNMKGFTPFQLDALWPGVSDIPWVSLVIYLLIFDLADYFYHRAQHRYAWFWSLHAVHHSQRQMTVFSDNRNHLLDDVMRDSVLVLVSYLIGVSPGQFVMIVVITQLIESLSHANLRISFGKWGERLMVSPRFHRHHHSIEYDASTSGPAGGYNFAVLFPVWDILFKTARWNAEYAATGIHDQIADPLTGRPARDYGQTFWAQQRLALKSMFKGLA
jgi:sterol desaturase/sphingolipid hydroxylase (fatty acid hydroxylase superfamily)